MRRLPLLGLLLLIPVFGALTVLPGCGKKDGTTKDTPPVAKKDEGGKKDEGKKDEGKTAGGKKEPIKASDGVVKGRVVYDGTPPKPAVIPQAAAHANCKQFSAAENSDDRWLVSEDGGVANVVVYLKPPTGKYFEPSDKDKNRTDVVTIDQPKCAFEPRVQVLYPAYWDGSTYKSSGQKFHIQNSAGFNHNTQWEGDPAKNPTGGRNISPKDKIEADLNPQSTPLTLKCDIHPWMRAKVWAFDHPYAARTDKDGNFEIRNVPTGTEVSVLAWHEDVGSFYGDAKTGEKKTFKSGDNSLPDIKVKAK